MGGISVANQNVSAQRLNTFDPGVSGACCSRSRGDPGSRLEAHAHSNDGDLRWADWKRWRCWGWCWWIWGTCHRSCGGGGGGDDGDGGGWRGTLHWPAKAVPPVAPCGHSEVGAALVEGAVWHLSDGRWIGGDPRSWGGYQRVRRYAGGKKCSKWNHRSFYQSESSRTNVLLMLSLISLNCMSKNKFRSWLHGTWQSKMNVFL